MSQTIEGQTAEGRYWQLTDMMRGAGALNKRHEWLKKHVYSLTMVGLLTGPGDIDNYIQYLEQQAETLKWWEGKTLFVNDGDFLIPWKEYAEALKDIVMFNVEGVGFSCIRQSLESVLEILNVYKADVLFIHITNAKEFARCSELVAAGVKVVVFPRNDCYAMFKDFRPALEKAEEEGSYLIVDRMAGTDEFSAKSVLAQTALFYGNS